MIKKNKILELERFHSYLLILLLRTWDLEKWSNLSKVIQKITTDPRLEFMALNSQYKALPITSNSSPMKMLAKSKFCAERYLMAKLFLRVFLTIFSPNIPFISSCGISSEQGFNTEIVSPWRYHSSPTNYMEIIKYGEYS